MKTVYHKEMEMELKIKNFKCFKEVSISFADITVLSGVNGSGKSTIVQALLLQKKFFDENQDIIKEVIQKKTTPRPVLLNDKNDGGLNLVNSREILNDDSPDEDFIQFNIIESKTKRYSIKLLIPDSEPKRQVSISLDYQIDSSFLETPFASKEKFYYLCAERIGPRIRQELSEESPPKIGYRGEYLAHMITEFSRKKIQKKRCFPDSKIQNYFFEHQLSLWLDFIVPSMSKIQSEKSQDSDWAQIKFIQKNRSIKNATISTNTGFGISYFLPILGCCLLASDKSMIIIENPEAHLSPQGQSRIGSFLRSHG